MWLCMWWIHLLKCVCVCLNIKYISVGANLFVKQQSLNFITALRLSFTDFVWRECMSDCAFQASNSSSLVEKNISYVWFHSRLRHCIAVNYVDLYRNVYGSWLAIRVNKLLISILDFIKRQSLRVIAPVFNGEAYRPRSFLTVLSISNAFDR